MTGILKSGLKLHALEIRDIRGTHPLGRYLSNRTLIRRIASRCLAFLLNGSNISVLKIDKMKVP